MSPQEFTRRHERGWQTLETLLAATTGSAERQQLPRLYRQVCQHLALARERHYPPALVEQLNRLVVSAHHQLYASREPLTGRVTAFLLRDFPALVRHHAGIFWLSALVFFGSLAATGIAVVLEPSLIFSIMDSAQVQGMEQMYDPSRRVVGFERDDASDFLMFGYYIRNNIGIGFQTFAGGMLAGVGSLVILLFNGVFIGAVAGHLTRIGYGETFWSFVCGHGSFELIAIVLCGMAGLMLGRALVAPGRRTRRDALRQEARVAVQILYGATFFLLLAAAIEAFWSSSTAIPATVKYAVAAALWTGIALYFLFTGRGGHADADR